MWYNVIDHEHSIRLSTSSLEEIVEDSESDSDLDVTRDLEV